MNKNDTAVMETIREAVGNAAVGKVFGEPVSRDDITIVPVAKVSGGGGGGGGEGGPAQAGTDSSGKDQEKKGSGTGGGFGLSAKPAGAFVIQNGSVRWRPAVDVNKIILGGQVVAVVAILAVRAIIKARTQLAEPGRGTSRR